MKGGGKKNKLKKTPKLNKQVIWSEITVHKHEHGWTQLTNSVIFFPSISWETVITSSWSATMSLAESLGTLDYSHICVESTSFEIQKVGQQRSSARPLIQKRIIMTCFLWEDCRGPIRRGVKGGWVKSQIKVSVTISEESCLNWRAALHPLCCYGFALWLVTHHGFFSRSCGLGIISFG